jgi:hypothetical protein
MAVADHPTAATIALATLAFLCIILFVSCGGGGRSGFTGGCPARRCAPGVCKTMWDPAASAEAQGLATVGATNFQHSSQAEQQLQLALNSALT